MNKVRVLAGAALLLLPVTAAYAQKPSLPLPPHLFIAPKFHEIPTDQWVYEDLFGIRNRRETRTLGYPRGNGSYHAYEREEFARLVAGELRAMDNTLEQEVRADPSTWRALCRLVQEFAPELKRQNIDVTSVLNRLLRSGKNLAVRKADYPFSDVPTNHWASGAVERLREAGILVGYSDSRFQSNSLH